MDQTVSALGLALIALAGASAGFLAASVPTASPSDEAPIAPGEARVLDPAPSTFTFASAGEAPARLLVFDEDARYQGSLEAAPGEPTTASLDRETAIVFVPTTSPPVHLRTPADVDDPEPTPVRETPRRLATADGGTVDEELTVTIPNRPASLGLTVGGSAQGLHVSVRTSEGPALRQTNETTAPDEPGQVRLEPANLTNGTYRVSVHADRLDGTIGLVAHHLAVDDSLEPLSAPDEQLDALGTVVARVQQGQAWQIPAAETDELALALERGARADVRLYGPDHRVHREVELGQQGPDWSWGSNETQGPAYEVVWMETPSNAYTVYGDAIEADTDRVLYVLAADEADPQPGRPTEIGTRTVQVPYASADGQSPAETIRYAGGLLDVSVTGGEGPAVDRRVTVDGPLGIVLDRRDQAAADGTHALTSRAQHVERFGAGPLDIRVDADAAVGSVELTLQHYIP